MTACACSGWSSICTRLALSAHIVATTTDVSSASSRAWMPIAADSAFFQQVVDRNPIYAGRLHSNGVDPARFEPGDQGVQVGRKGRKDPDRLRITVGRHSDDD